MSEKIEITASLVQEISVRIKQENIAKLQDLIADLHVADIAEILEELSVSHAQFLYQIIDEEKSAEILVELNDDLKIKSAQVIFQIYLLTLKIRLVD